MDESRRGFVADRFKSNLLEAGIPVTETDIETAIESGFLRQAEAFDEAVASLEGDALPDYLECEYPAGAVSAAAVKGRGPTAATFLGESGLNGAQALSPLRMSIAEVGLLLRSRQLAPTELLRICLERIHARDPRINAFQVLLDDEALRDAKRAEDEILGGRYRGPLHGVPVAVKDLLDVKGSPTAAGSLILAKRVAERDSNAVACLRAAGAVVVGKTRMSEFAYSPGSNNEHYGPTRNPCGLDRDSGGSSSGSAAAVADGMVFASVGTDTGGSIRIPAAFCGLVGLKPSFGRVGLGGSVSLSWSLDHLGPIARSAADAAILLAALEGPDSRDPRTGCWSAVAPSPGAAKAAGKGSRGALRGKGAAGLRVGVLGDDGSGRPLASTEALGAWKAVLAALEAAGASLVPIDLPRLRALRAVNTAILAMEGVAFHLPWLRSRLGEYGDFMRLRFLGGFAYGAADFVRAQRARAELRRLCAEALSGVDILSLPSTSAEAPALGTPARIGLTAPFNALGWPSLSLPAGKTAAGLPLGAQIVGKPWADYLLLDAARCAESAIRF